MDDKELENIKEFLRLKKLQEEDKSDEMLEEIYKETIGSNDAWED